MTLEAESRIAKGWMPDGWGGYRFVLRNTGAAAVTVTRWTARWEAKGKVSGDPWGGAVGVVLKPGEDLTRDEIGFLPMSVVKAAEPDAPVMVGAFAVLEGGATSEIAFRIPVPGAVLPEPLRRVTGRTVAIEVMESRFAALKHLDRTLAWVDQCYAAMIELTGERPYGGKVMVFKEAPEHPWWAYAGREVILNTKYVGETLEDFEAGLMSFGWIHEVGHSFDVLGPWYIWNGPSAEWQANLKLCHAFETIEDRSFRIRWTFQAPGYPAPDAGTRLTGGELVERFFLVFGDRYLGDPSRTWDTLSSDEMHSMFQRIQRVYGWDVFKRWYRTYRSLADAGYKPPETAEEKVSLIAAILCREAGVDLVPIFRCWRFPVTSESVKAMNARYLAGR